MLVALDLLLVGVILEVAVAVDEVTLTRLATVAGLRIGLTLLIAFEDAYRTDTAGSRGSISRPWAKGLGRARDVRQTTSVVGADQRAENVWADRARLGRDWRRTAG